MTRSLAVKLDEDKLGFKRVMNNIAEHAVQSQLKTFEEKYSPKKCPNCGKLKKAGRKMVIAVDAARRFAYFGKHPQQPSSVQLVSSDSVKDGHSGNEECQISIRSGKNGETFKVGRYSICTGKIESKNYEEK